jgi:arylsulfatase A-like enzyme
MTATQPNIILIMTDQQRYDTIGALGYPHMETPVLDRMVNEGVTFTNCHITAPSCVPARASLFTGYYPHTTGVMRNGDAWQRTWVERLADVGYHCVNVGKMHTIPYESPSGFHERYVVENKDRYMEGRYYFDEWDKALAAHGLVKQQRRLYRKRDDYRERLGAFEWELPEHLHSDVFVGNFAKWWVDTYPQTEPLFLQVGFPGPHPPYDPIPRYAESYLKKDLPLPQPTAEELDALPPAYKIMREHNVEVDHDSVVWNLDPPRDALHRMWAYYLANVTMIDEKIGELLQSLDDQGYLDNAVVIFVSDHGDCMGDHGQIQKWTFYEEIIRTPCIVWSKNPDLIAGGGRRVDGLCQLFDLGPTILEMAGASVPDDFEARSLRGALRDEAWQPRDYVFCEQGADTNLTGTRMESMVRSERWKLVHFLGEDAGQLFDLENDPKELRNLWDDPDHAETKREMREVLFNWRLESGYATRNWCMDSR